MEPSRRQFVLDGGRLLLTLPIGWTIAGSLSGCEEECTGPGTAKVDGDKYTFMSSCDSGHNHSFSLAMAEVVTPPTGGVNRASSAYEGGHTHTVEVTEAELMQIQGGMTVTKPSAAANGHTHAFTFKKP